MVTADRYVDILRNFLESEPKELEHPDVCYQQDGATAHLAKRTMNVSREMLPRHLICGDAGWPAPSRDLARCVFCLRGYLKAKVFEATIRKEITIISPEFIA